MPENEIRLGKLTRREFREAHRTGRFSSAIIPTGALEQHLEHLAMEHDTASACHIAEKVAKRLYPQVVVCAPLMVGVSEHHMAHKGTISIKVSSFLSVLFDTIESLARHGVRNILILNGHAGNTGPIESTLRQWLLGFQHTSREVNLQFCSYWDLLDEGFTRQHVDTRSVPGHATEFETAFALAANPENVRLDAVAGQDVEGPAEATAEKGRALVEESVRRVTEFVSEMIDGRIQAEAMKHG